jgi:hypothetical protein
MRSIPFVLALGATAAGCATDGLEDENLAESEARIIGGGTVTEANRHDRGLVDVGIGAGGICSGSLIATDWVITATHCIDFANLANNSFSIPNAPVANGSSTRRARRAIQMDTSDVTLVELEPLPTQGLVFWPTSFVRTAYSGPVGALLNTNMTCYGRGGSGYQTDANGGLTFDGWHDLTRLVTHILDGRVHVSASGSPGQQITAPGDSGGLCMGPTGLVEAVVSAGSWSCTDPSSDGSCKSTITSVSDGYWLVTQPWAGIINSIAGKKPLGLWNDSYSDANGWSLGPQYYSTIAYPDVSGDDRSDVCGRGSNGIWCAVSQGDSGFAGTKLWEASFSDANGWHAPQYYSTIRFPDVNGDHKADVCGRGGNGIWCATSNGSSFTGIAQWDGAFSDGNGWDGVKYYSTLQFSDVNGDGKADVCGRGSDGIWCATSSGAGFNGATRWIANFADAGGWGAPQYYSTIRFADVNGDGKADVCGRGGAGIYCGLSSGSSFSALTLWNSSFSDANGWNGGPQYYSTIRFPDVNGDGRADVCGRGGAGINCAISSGAAFTGTSLWLNNFADAGGWNSGPQYYSTIRFTDLDADGKADVCGRGGAGMYCAASNGSSFAGFTLWDAAMSDAGGWNAAPYYTTIAFPDVDSDYHSELCGRGLAGIYCER